MPSLNHFKSLKKLKRKGYKLISNGTELITNKFERIMIVCNGYNKIQPIVFSRGVSTMLPNSIVLNEIPNSNDPFRAGFGSKKIRSDKRNTVLESNGKLYVDNVQLDLNSLAVQPSTSLLNINAKCCCDDMANNDREYQLSPPRHCRKRFLKQNTAPELR